MIKASSITKVGIIAGDGYLPLQVYEACIKNDIPNEVISLENETNLELFKKVSHHIFPVYKISKILKFMKNAGITHVTFAGKVRRTEISRLLLDIKGAKLFASILKNGLADNSILTTILNFIEREGFQVVAPEQIAKDIVLCKGAITKIKPNKSAIEDIKQGQRILRSVASLDVGQSLVIQNGLILGVEAAEGTDELIKRCGEIQQKDGDKPILIKICKPTQDTRVDLPCIGPNTIECANKYGIRGIVAEAGKTLVLDLKQTKDLANKFKIFIYGI